MENEEIIFFLFTCVKDGRKYVSKLFNSLLNQTKINFVHFIYEDGSSDPIDDLVDDYRKKANMLSTPYKVIYEKSSINIGLNMATQYCINQCDRDYFIWIDCDNYVDRNFFLELGKLARRNKKSAILRSRAVFSKNGNSNFKIANVPSVELQYFLRSIFYYSFFAVKFDKYLEINKNNYISNIKTFYNDDQIILLLLLAKVKMSFSKKAIGFFLEREDSESSMMILISEGKDDQLDFLKKINNNYYKTLKAYYDCKKKINEIDIDFRRKPLKCYKELKTIYKICKENKLDYSILHYRTKFCNLIRFLYFRLFYFLLNK